MNKTLVACQFLCFIMICFNGFSQKDWTLDECIAYALEHNLGQQSQVYNESIGKENWNQSKRDMFPQIYTSLPSYNVSYGRTVDPYTNTIVNTKNIYGINGGLSTSIVLFESFKKWNALAYQKIQFETNKQSTEQSKYDLAFKIMNLYNDVLFNEGALSIVTEQQSINLLQYKLISSQVELGMKAKADLYEIEATVSSDELSVLQANNRLKEAKLALIQEMNLPQDDIELLAPLENQSINESLTNVDAESLFNKAQQFLPTLQMEKLNVKAAEKNLAITKAAFFPKITFNTGISTSYFPNRLDTSGNEIEFWDQTKSNTYKYIGFSLNIPIFGNGRNWSNTKIARINLLKANVDLEQKKQVVQKEIQMLIQKNEALLAEDKLNSKKVELKELTLTIAQKKLKNGLITLYDLQAINNEFISAKIDQLRMRIQFNIQKKTLDFYNGTFILPTLTQVTNN
ncbi:TolC family protein [Confluentibacter sediminis]|uniref:TolC family protein n=1 Tax=Confluentibacter sediminis TaxID=2219045 RepID=UPI000DAC596B|nr:TolC family protein [Confluentibacter sediminis]